MSEQDKGERSMTFPELPLPFTHGAIGPLYDRFQMHQYAATCADAWQARAAGGESDGLRKAPSTPVANPEVAHISDGESQPDGYAVTMADGWFVGAWQSPEIAERVASQGPAKEERRVRPFAFLPTEKKG